MKSLSLILMFISPFCWANSYNLKCRALQNGCDSNKICIDKITLKTSSSNATLSFRKQKLFADPGQLQKFNTKQVDFSLDSGGQHSGLNATWNSQSAQLLKTKASKSSLVGNITFSNNHHVTVLCE